MAIAPEISKLLPNLQCPFCKTTLETPEDWGYTAPVGETAPIQCNCEHEFHVRCSLLINEEYSPLDTIYFLIIPKDVYVKSHREIKEVRIHQGVKLCLEVPLDYLDFSNPFKFAQRLKDLLVFS